MTALQTRNRIAKQETTSGPQTTQALSQVPEAAPRVFQGLRCGRHGSTCRRSDRPEDGATAAARRIGGDPVRRGRAQPRASRRRGGRDGGGNPSGADADGPDHRLPKRHCRAVLDRGRARRQGLTARNEGSVSPRPPAPLAECSLSRRLPTSSIRRCRLGKADQRRRTPANAIKQRWRCCAASASGVALLMPLENQVAYTSSSVLRTNTSRSGTRKNRRAARNDHTSSTSSNPLYRSAHTASAPPSLALSHCGSVM